MTAKVQTGLTDAQDAYGHLVLDWYEGRPAPEIVERCDGLIMTSPVAQYFAPARRWVAPERRAMRWVRGRVLDVGCGPGRVALHLQQRGHAVTGIDISPLAINVARARGVKDARVLSIDEIGRGLGMFDTVVMLGNNFGLLRSPRNARRLLRRLASATTADARVIASSLDVNHTHDRFHREYNATNQARGQLAGQMRLRVRHRQYATPWFDYLMVSDLEMADLARNGGWELVRRIGEGPYYVAVLAKRGRPPTGVDARSVRH